MTKTDIIGRIDAAEDATGIDLAPAYARLAEVRARGREIEKLKTDRNAVVSAVNALASATPENVPAAWEKVVDAQARYNAWEAARETIFNATHRAEESVTKNAAWKALALLTEHVEKIGREITKISQYDIDTPERAIAAKRVKEYERLHALASELDTIAAMPEIGHRDYDGREVLVIAPPEIPQYRNSERPNPEDEGKGEHTEDETRLHQQALDFKRANGLAQKLLTAARNGWTITPATTLTEYNTRGEQIENGTTYINGAFRHRIS